MVGAIRGELLYFLVILQDAVSFSMQEKEEITALYKDKTEMRNVYTRLKNSNFNKCRDEMPVWHRAELPHTASHEDIGTKVVMVEDESTALTLDGQTNFDIPGYIVCTIEGVRDQLMVLIDKEPNGQKSTIAKIFQYKRPIGGKIVFQTKEVLTSRFIRKAYTEPNLTKMSNSYIIMAHSNNSKKDKCDNILKQHRYYDTEQVEGGLIQFGRYTLHLNEFEVFSLPAVLTCMLLYGPQRTPKVMHFITDLRLENWYRVYTIEHYPPMANVHIRQSFTFEQHIVVQYLV